MDFDDLHDPHPPRPGPDTVAAVAGRARRLRRRRALVITAGAAAALAAIVVPVAFVVTGDSADNRIVPATVPDTVGSTVPDTVEPTPTTSAAPAMTAASMAPPITSSPSSTVAPVPAPLVSAILGNGDAVLIAEDLSARLVYDGSDPQDMPTEGELVIVDSVVVTGGGRMFVSTCCEPVPGTWFEVDAAGRPLGEVRYGHALALSPGGTRLASVGASGITVTDLDGAIVSTADLSSATAYRQPESVLWLDDQTLAVVELRQTEPGSEFRLYTVGADLAGIATAEGAVIGSDLEATWPHVGGIADDGSILVFRGARGGTVSDRLEAYDPVTFAARPASDVVLPEPGVDAWYDSGLTWVGVDDRLHVGNVLLPDDAGNSIAQEFAWARPVAG